MNDRIYDLIIEESCMLNYHLLKKPMINTNHEITLHFNIHEFYYNALDYITPRWRLLHNLNYVELGKKVVFPIYSQYKSTPS